MLQYTSRFPFGNEGLIPQLWEYYQKTSLRCQTFGEITEEIYSAKVTSPPRDSPLLMTDQSEIQSPDLLAQTQDNFKGPSQPQGPLRLGQGLLVLYLSLIFLLPSSTSFFFPWCWCQKHFLHANLSKSVLPRGPKPVTGMMRYIQMLGITKERERDYFCIRIAEHF